MKFFMQLAPFKFYIYHQGYSKSFWSLANMGVQISGKAWYRVPPLTCKNQEKNSVSWTGQPQNCPLPKIIIKNFGGFLGGKFFFGVASYGLYHMGVTSSGISEIIGWQEGWNSLYVLGSFVSGLGQVLFRQQVKIILLQIRHFTIIQGGLFNWTPLNSWSTGSHANSSRISLSASS